MPAAPDVHLPAGSTARGPWSVSLSPERAGWEWTGLQVVNLTADGAVCFGTGQAEVLVVPLAGSCIVECDGERVELAGRASVLAGPTDFAYVPRDSTLRLHSASGGRFALPSAAPASRLPFRYGPVAGVASEARGAGACSRLVRNFCTPDVLEADRLIACEVITPAGN